MLLPFSLGTNSLCRVAGSHGCCRFRFLSRCSLFRMAHKYASTIQLLFSRYGTGISSASAAGMTCSACVVFPSVHQIAVWLLQVLSFPYPTAFVWTLSTLLLAVRTYSVGWLLGLVRRLVGRLVSRSKALLWLLLSSSTLIPPSHIPSHLLIPRRFWSCFSSHTGRAIAGGILHRASERASDGIVVREGQDGRDKLLVCALHGSVRFGRNRVSFSYHPPPSTLPSAHSPSLLPPRAFI